MNKFLSCFLTFTVILTGGIQSYATAQENDNDLLASRFILKSDIQIDSLSSIPFRASWWSRPQEYAWAAEFVDEDAVVLDAACGISHPFKWYLGETCLEAWACDADPRISSIDAIIQNTYEDLGEVAHTVLSNTPRLYEDVIIVECSICQLPNDMPQFDRIFCISTLEHLSDKDRQDAMTQFAQHLSPTGLLVITVDYPEVTPQKLIALAKAAGLVPAGHVILDAPAKGILTNGYYSIYRAVFKHKEAKWFDPAPDFLDIF